MAIVDTADLLDSAEVADLVGLANQKAVSVYRSRYDDFPEPVVVKRNGNWQLWLRDDVETWARATGRL